MEWNEIEQKLLRAKAEFLKADRDLLVINANERSMTHKFAEHLQREFPDWKVDCEYNRNGDVPKQLHWMLDGAVAANDEDGHTVFPDIIIHRRGKRDNLLVIEAKKSSNRSGNDREKLEAFIRDDRYEYSFGVMLQFVNEEPFGISIERC
jgi:hypothetical protein